MRKVWLTEFSEKSFEENKVKVNDVFVKLFLPSLCITAAISLKLIISEKLLHQLNIDAYMGNI